MTRIKSNYEANLGVALAMQLESRMQGKPIEAYNASVATSKEDLWTQSGLHTWMITPAGLKISSGSVSDSDVDVSVEVLLPDWTTAIWNVNTDGQTEKDIQAGALAIRVNRAWVSGPIASVGKIYIYEDDTVVAGVPQTATKIHAVIEIVDQESKHGWWSIPDGWEGYVMDWQVDTLAAIIMTNRVEIREFGGVFIGKDRILINAQDKSKTKFIPFVCPAKSDVKLTSIGASGSSLVDGSLSLFLHKI